MHDCMITKQCMEVTATGEWLDRGDPALRDMELNVDYVDRCTPSVAGTIFFFVCFILLCAFVMLNLVIAVILNNFESYSQKMDLPVSEEDFSEFATEWGRIDRFGTYYIKIVQFPKLLKSIRAPLGVKTLPRELQKSDSGASTPHVQHAQSRGENPLQRHPQGARESRRRPRQPRGIRSRGFERHPRARIGRGVGSGGGDRHRRRASFLRRGVRAVRVEGEARPAKGAAKKTQAEEAEE